MAYKKRPMRDPWERFLEKVEKTDKCWLWRAGKSHGYGRFFANGKGGAAHRYSYEHAKGKVPDGLVIDHLCKNKGCVNPDHMEPVTSQENFRRCDLAIRRLTHCIKGHAYAEAGFYKMLTHNGRTFLKCCKRCVRNHGKNYQSRKNARRLADSIKFRKLGLRYDGKPRTNRLDYFAV